MPIPRLSPNGPDINLPSSPPEFDNGPSGAGDFFIDWSKGSSQKVLLTGNATLQLYRGLPTNGETCWLQLSLRQDDTGNRVPAFQGVMTPDGGTDLVLSTDPGALDIVSLYFNGTALSAQVAGLDFQ